MHHRPWCKQYTGHYVGPFFGPESPNMAPPPGSSAADNASFAIHMAAQTGTNTLGRVDGTFIPERPNVEDLAENTRYVQGRVFPYNTTPQHIDRPWMANWVFKRRQVDNGYSWTWSRHIVSLTRRCK